MVLLAEMWNYIIKEANKPQNQRLKDVFTLPGPRNNLHSAETYTKTDNMQTYQLKYETHLKNPLQPSQVMALKWKPVALSPQTPQIRGALRSNSSGPTTDVVTVMGSITEEKKEKTIEVTTAAPRCLGHKN